MTPAGDWQAAESNRNPKQPFAQTAISGQNSPLEIILGQVLKFLAPRANRKPTRVRVPGMD